MRAGRALRLASLRRMTQSSAKFRIGTRGSPLSLTQTEAVRARLAAAHGLAPEAFEIVVLRTSGDEVRDRRLAELGGKGLFTKEIEEALLAGRIDLAVHSAKDVPTFLPGGLALAAFPFRADPRDAFVSARAKSLTGLPRGAVVGTASIRREALVRRLRPDLEMRLLRGNVGTRLEKAERGEVDAAVLALAGLQRLGLAGHVTEVLDPDVFPPAVAQGAIAIETRERDARVRDLVAAVDDSAVAIAVRMERAFLAELDGSCRTPIAGHARVADGRARFYGLVISPDGREAVETRREGSAADAEALGADAGRELRARAPMGALLNPA
jgi:hydroxymethylbilane synthase